MKSEQAASVEASRISSVHPKAEVARAQGQEPLAVSLSEGDGGQTHILHTVVAKIAGMAAREISGVYELAPFDTSQAVTRLTRRVTGRAMRNLGVNVEVGTAEAAVDVRIVTEYGASIVEVCRELRANVRNRVESATGLSVVEVNVEVVDLHFPTEAEVPAPRRVR